MKRFLPVIGALVGGAIAFAIAWHLASADIGEDGDWRGGAQRFIGMVGALGVAAGYIVTSRLTRGAKVTRDGFTVSYRPAEPVPQGYRELRTLRVEDLIARLRAVGYAPRVEVCNELGERGGAAEADAALVGANIALVDRGVRGWVRVQLPAPGEGQARAIGLVEVWTASGESAWELGLFTLRALGELVGGLAAARESSRLSEDPVATVTAALPERPKHRAS